MKCSIVVYLEAMDRGARFRIEAERGRRTMEPLITFHEARAAQLKDVCLSEEKQTNGVVKDETSRDSATV